MSNTIREFVGAAHGDLETVKRLLAADPSLLNVVYEWMPNNTETPLQAASHVCNREIAQYLLEQGAPMTVITAAMLADEASFQRLLAEDPERIHEKGGHGISLLFHAVIGGNKAIAETVYQGASEPNLREAMVASVNFEVPEMAHWCIAKGAPLDGKDWRGISALEIAVQRGYEDIVAIMREKIGEANLEACSHCGEKGYKYLAKLEGNPMGEHTKHFACKKCGQEWGKA